jgi:hypothetical protein
MGSTTWCTAHVVEVRNKPQHELYPAGFRLGGLCLRYNRRGSLWEQSGSHTSGLWERQGNKVEFKALRKSGRAPLNVYFSTFCLGGFFPVVVEIRIHI